MDRNILLVQPRWPIARKSKWHAKYLPIGLLKLATYYRSKGCAVKLVYGNVDPTAIPFVPDEIKITSLFTYWWRYVKEAFDHYTKLYPDAKIDIGGIYASLMPSHVKEQFGIQPAVGVLEEAERNLPAYDLVEPINYQIIHASRGCSRRCPYCGAYIIEPRQSFKTWHEVKREICKNMVIFYDNDFLANPHIIDILEGLANYRHNGKVLHCEAQSGLAFWRITLEIAMLLKKARFRAIRISWDRGFEDFQGVLQALKKLTAANYNYKNIQIFMLYNYFPFELLERKRKVCDEIGVQIADCRYRPLDQLYDDYNPYKKHQTSKDYYIHKEEGWTDELVRKFRKAVRAQNICKRFGFQDLAQYYDWIRHKKIYKPLCSKPLNLNISQKTLFDYGLGGKP